MDNILYQSIIVPFPESRDGETATKIVVTQEINCVVAWKKHADGDEILAHFRTWQRDEAIEFAVDQSRRMRAERKKAA